MCFSQGWSMSSGYVGFPEIEQTSGISSSCPSWANFEGIRQATGGDLQMRKYLEIPKHIT